MENQRMKEKGIKLFEAEKPKPLRRRKDSGDLLKTAKPLSSTASSANKGIAARKEESISARTSPKGVAALDKKLILANESIGRAENFEKFKKLRLATKRLRRGEKLTADEIELLIQEELECKPHYEDEMEQEMEFDGESYLSDDGMFGSNSSQDVPSDCDSDSESLDWERIFEQVNAPNSEEAGDSIGRSSVTDDKHVGIPSSNRGNSGQLTEENDINYHLTATLNPAAVQSEDIRISREKGIKLFNAETPRPLKRRKVLGDLLKATKPLSSTASSANKGIAACKEESISAHTSTKGVAALDKKLILANESIGRAEKVEKFKKLRLATKKSRRGEELTADEIDLLIQEELECKPHYEDELEQDIEWVNWKIVDGGSYLSDDVTFGSNSPQDVPSDGDSDSESLDWERIFERVNAPNSEEACGDIPSSKHEGCEG